MVIVLCLVLTWRQNSYWRGEIPLFERAVRFEPHLGRARVLLGKAYYFNREYDRAIVEYQSALKIMQGYIGQIRRGTARRAQQSAFAQASAEQFYWGWVKGISFDLAHCHEGKHDYLQAIADYNQALAVDPRDGVIRNNIGTDYLYLNNIEAAQKSFLSALGLNPRDVLAMTNLAVCHLQKGEDREAERLLRQALTVAPDFPSAKTNLEKLMKKSKE